MEATDVGGHYGLERALKYEVSESSTNQKGSNGQEVSSGSGRGAHCGLMIDNPLESISI
jgi:hypothetical protein